MSQGYCLQRELKAKFDMKDRGQILYYLRLEDTSIGLALLMPLMVGIWYGFLEEHEARFYCTTEVEDVVVCTISSEVVWLCKIFNGLFDDMVDSIVILRELGFSWKVEMHYNSRVWCKQELRSYNGSPWMNRLLI